MLHNSPQISCPECACQNVRPSSSFVKQLVFFLFCLFFNVFFATFIVFFRADFFADLEGLVAITSFRVDAERDPGVGCEVYCFRNVEAIIKAGVVSQRKSCDTFFLDGRMPPHGIVGPSTMFYLLQNGCNWLNINHGPRNAMGRTIAQCQRTDSKYSRRGFRFCYRWYRQVQAPWGSSPHSRRRKGSDLYRCRIDNFVGHYYRLQP